MRRAALLVGCTLLSASFFLTSQAQAQDRCARIQSELANAHNGGGGQLGAAINQQSAELARARGAYDRFRCSFGAHPQCGSIVATIHQMESNLAEMRRQQARSGGGIDRNRIAELERVFATQCGPNQRQQPVQAATPRNQGNSLLAAIFGTRSHPVAVQRNRDAGAVILPSQPANRGFYRPGEVFREPEFQIRGNTFRTMCVRTSDGFYWPISFSTTRDRFDEDQSSCQAMCPGVGVELYAYRNPGQQVDAMVSTRTGLPYADQDYAFSYRTEFDPANRCRPSAAMLEELRPSAGLALMQQPSGPHVPSPSPRPDMATDPETRALQASNSSFADLASLSSRTTGDQELVRVVGPNYGYFAD